MNYERIVEEPVSFNRCIPSFRSKWATLNKWQKSESIQRRHLLLRIFSKKGFLKPDVTDEPTVAQSSDEFEGDEVEEIEKIQDEASTCTSTLAIIPKEQMLHLLY